MPDWKLFPKRFLTQVGSVSPQPLIYALNGVFNYLHVGWWLQAHRLEVPLRVRDRGGLFKLAAREIGERDVLYLEFGVHRGESMRAWSDLLSNPASKLHGFDSFEGLPHDWSLEGHARGYFATGGALPVFEDPRVRLFPGWFEDTLPTYEWPEHDVLFAMFDADLYSSTVTALAAVRPHLRSGSFVYFDQFHHRCDELRAFAEMIDEHDLAFKVVGATRELSSVLFRLV
jgi:hypothetical protein